MRKAADHDPEVEAIRTMIRALRSLDPGARKRVSDYVLARIAAEPWSQNGAMEPERSHGAETEPEDEDDGE